MLYMIYAIQNIIQNYRSTNVNRMELRLTGIRMEEEVVFQDEVLKVHYGIQWKWEKLTDKIQER